MISNKYERMVQIYNWYRTARLNVLYYEESLRHWTWAVRGHDLLIALGGTSSPIAFWQHSSQPMAQQAWFYLTLLTAFLAILKPILRWDNQLKLYTELHTHYCDLYMDLKCLVEDITAEADLTAKANVAFEHCRTRFKELERKEPPPNNKKIRRLEGNVKTEININACWFPAESEVSNV